LLYPLAFTRENLSHHPTLLLAEGPAFHDAHYIAYLTGIV